MLIHGYVTWSPRVSPVPIAPMNRCATMCVEHFGPGFQTLHCLDRREVEGVG